MVRRVREKRKPILSSTFFLPLVWNVLHNTSISNREQLFFWFIGFFLEMVRILLLYYFLWGLFKKVDKYLTFKNKKKQRPKPFWYLFQWTFWSYLFIHPLNPDKGQTNSKWFFQADIPSKKLTNKFNFTTCWRIFWKKVKTPKINFEINWPLECWKLYKIEYRKTVTLQDFIRMVK